MKTNKYALILSLVVAGAAGAVRGDDKPSVPSRPDDRAVPAARDADAKAGDAVKDDPAESLKRVHALAEKYGVTDLVIMDMRKNNLGFGEIEHALTIAQHIVRTSTTAITFDDALKQVLSMRAEGAGWGQIAEKYGAKLGHLKRDGVDEKPDGRGRDGRPDHPDKPDKPERPVKPDKPEKPETPGRSR